MAAAAPYLFGFVISFLFAYYTGRIAGRKGRSPVTWGIVGFFLGIFGVLIAWLTPAKRPALD